MENSVPEKPSAESVRLAMKIAWEDHHHARDQTWKAVQFVGLLVIGVITVEYKFHSFLATMASSLVLLIAAAFTILIAFQHRKLERRKFFHIMLCEEWLGLHRNNLIPLKMTGYFNQILNDPKAFSEALPQFDVDLPELYRFIDIFKWKINNTSIFIVRMVFLIVAFLSVFIVISYFR